MRVLLGALLGAVEELKGDQEVVLAAARQDAHGLQYAEPQLNKHPDFLAMIQEQQQ